MKFSNVVVDFIFTTYAVLLVSYFGAYIRLYLMCKKSKKTVIICGTVVFIIVEALFIYHFFFRKT